MVPIALFIQLTITNDFDLTEAYEANSSIFVFVQTWFAAQ
jgi:hypothetical protein